MWPLSPVARRMQVRSYDVNQKRERERERKLWYFVTSLVLPPRTRVGALDISYYNDRGIHRYKYDARPGK